MSSTFPVRALTTRFPLIMGAALLLVSTLLAATPTTAANAADEPAHTYRLSGEQRVLGPAHYVDSVYASVKGNDGKRYAYLSNETSYWFQVSGNGTLSNSRAIMSVGKKGSIDYCGVHPVGGIFKTTKTHWVTYYHAEQANPSEHGGNCYGGPGERNSTRWTVMRMDSFDAGKTWRKGAQVIRQDGSFTRTWPTKANSNQDDAGSPRLVVQGKYLYMFYRAVNRESPHLMQMSVARAPKGNPSDFRKYKHVKGKWTNAANWQQKGLGGQQGAIHGLPSTARGIAWNSYLKRYISVVVSRAGIKLYGSGTWSTESCGLLCTKDVLDGRDLSNWTHLKDLKGSYNLPSAWGKKCIQGQTPDFPMALGYGAAVGWNGDSQSTGQNFWVYYMLKPKGKCFNERYLVRRQVAVDAALKATPKLTHASKFAAVKKVGNGTGWNITTTLLHNGVPAMGRLVQVQVATTSGWVTKSTYRTKEFGIVPLYGYAGGTHRFYAPKSGSWPAVSSTAFTRPYRR